MREVLALATIKSNIINNFLIIFLEKAKEV